MLTRFFTHSDKIDEQLDALVRAALAIMADVLNPLVFRSYAAAACQAARTAWICSGSG